MANFILENDPLCLLKEHSGSDKQFFFTAYDCSEDSPLIEKFVLKFGNAESNLFINLDAAKFKSAFTEAKEFNKAVKEGGELKYAPVISEKDDEDKKDEKKDNKDEKTDK